jgi:hypothetical protein
MDPVSARAIAAERARELQAAAIVAKRAHPLRRSRQARRPRLLTGIARVQVLRSAPGPLRGPRAA